jgi:hypothetical protein
MRKIEISNEVKKILNKERFEHPHAEVRRRMTVTWMQTQNFSQQQCALIANISTVLYADILVDLKKAA